MARRTINVSDDTWRGARLRAIADGKTISEVVEAAIRLATIGGPLIYGNDPEADRLRSIQQWAGGTESGKRAQHEIEEDLFAEPKA